MEICTHFMKSKDERMSRPATKIVDFMTGHRWKSLALHVFEHKSTPVAFVREIFRQALRGSLHEDRENPDYWRPDPSTFHVLGMRFHELDYPSTGEYNFGCVPATEKDPTKFCYNTHVSEGALFFPVRVIANFALAVLKVDSERKKERERKATKTS